MADGGDGRMRLTVLGGFLGSGKTTWLRHQLHAGGLSPVHVIVNEAAETPIDHALLAAAGPPTLLAGGCCCCDGREALLAALRRLADRRSRGDRLDRIVLETSGLADPGGIVAAIGADPVLVHHILVEEIVVTADALHALAQLRTEALGRRQVAVADRLIVTKSDVADPPALARLVATLRLLNPGAVISGTVQGQDVPLPDGSGAEPEALLDLGPESGPLRPSRVTLDADIDWTAFALWLSALLHARGDDLVRVKGVVPTPAGRLLLQAVRKVVQQPEILPGLAWPDPGDGVVVFIGRGYRPEDLRRSLRRFAGTR